MRLLCNLKTTIKKLIILLFLIVYSCHPVTVNAFVEVEEIKVIN